MDKKCFEEFGFVSTGWKEGILIVRVEIPLSKIKGSEKDFLKGKVTLHSGGEVIGKARLKPLRLSIATSEMDDEDCLEPVQFLVKCSTMVYEACISFPPEKCVKTDTTFKVKIGNMKTNPMPLGIPVNLPK